MSCLFETKLAMRDDGTRNHSREKTSNPIEKNKEGSLITSFGVNRVRS